MNATTGMVHLRTRISYQGSGAIVPCGTAIYGETEDYMVNITAASGMGELNPEIVSLFPNPTNDVLTIDFGGLEVNTVTIFDLSGKVILTYANPSSSKLELSTAGIAQGMYHVRIASPMGEITKSLIKN
jgi:hypothetical protein